MAKSTQESTHQTPDHIDQIRDIILGPQKRETDQRFDQFTSELRRQQESTTALVEELRALVKNAHASAEKAVEESRAALEADLTAKWRELSSGQQQHKQELSDLNTRFQSEIRTLRAQYAADLDRAIALLKETSLSKEALAGLLQELAVKVRGRDMLEELKSVIRHGTEE
jgi:uncharacterized phage infection (PIP) family protein YhgE